MRAVCLIREALQYRRDSFCLGLRNAGYDLVPNLQKPGFDDVLVVWQRYGYFDEMARFFEGHGARVVVCENGYLGKLWLDDEWFAMAIGHHAGAGQWPAGDDARWDRLKIELAPWRTAGSETVILGQRGIGEKNIASPDHWAENMRLKLRTGRVRHHPGNRNLQIPLERDLQNAQSVVTWASSAALRALMLGIPVWYDFKQWIGAKAATHVCEFGTKPPLRDDALRLQMFRRLIWAQWRIGEIRSGSAFKALLHKERVAA